jgi:hypothetical protein
MIATAEGHQFLIRSLVELEVQIQKVRMEVGKQARIVVETSSSKEYRRISQGILKGRYSECRGKRS